MLPLIGTSCSGPKQDPGTRAVQLGASLRILRLCILLFLSAECSTIALGNAAQRALWPSPSRHGVQHAPCSRCTPGNEQRSLEEHPKWMKPF
jgi:hypothetical protein